MCVGLKRIQQGQYRVRWQELVAMELNILVPYKLNFFVRGAISNFQDTTASLTNNDNMLTFAVCCSLLVAE